MIILFAIHLIVALFLVGVILLQKKEGGIGGLGGGGGSGGLGGLMSGRAKADGLSKATGLLAVAFFATSLALAVIGAHSRTSGPLVPETTGTTAPATAPADGTVPASGTATGGAAPAETAPAQPATPTVPAGN
jgi:preprotein translocase subunit SecG